MQQYDILRPNEKFKGRTYGEWAEEWWKKLLSDDPDSYEKDDDVVFLRGKYDYVDKGKKREPSTKPNINKRTGKDGLIICEGTGLFFPVVAAEFNEGDGDPDDETRILRNEEDCYECAKRDIEDGPAPTADQATINGDPIVNDLRSYRARSKYFPLQVNEGSSLRGKMEYEMPLGKHMAITDGYWILIKSLQASDKAYKLKFSATGRNQPRTNQYFNAAEYDVTVKRC
jgi:hypothetical protein